MNGLRWGDNSAFYLIFAIVAMVLFYFIFQQQNKNKLNKAFGDRIAPWLSQSVSKHKQKIRLFLEVIGCFFIVVALARPQLGQSQQEVKSEGVELMVLADVSDSMLAEDVKPSRLELMKVELEKLVDLMPGNKMGLIAFAGSSALMSPLTTDPGALKMYIQSLDVNAVTHQGTNFQVALSYAKEAFERGGVTQAENLKTTRVVLVLSDGEDQEPDAIAEAQKLNEAGIHIITVAYGTEKGASIPARDARGNLTGMRKDKSGQPIVTQVRGDFLKEIARKTDGEFYNSYFDGSHLRDIVSKINEYEKSEFATSMNVQYDEKFAIPLLFGVIFLSLSFLVSNRQPRTYRPKGIFDV